MSKYIKLEDAIYGDCILIDEIKCDDCPFYDEEHFLCRMNEWLESLPTIDIVRCKDCKHNPKRTNDFAYGRCVCCCEDDWYGYVPDDDFFCGHGERIEE